MLSFQPPLFVRVLRDGRSVTFGNAFTARMASEEAASSVFGRIARHGDEHGWAPGSAKAAIPPDLGVAIAVDLAAPAMAPPGPAFGDTQSAALAVDLAAPAMAPPGPAFGGTQDAALAVDLAAPALAPPGPAFGDTQDAAVALDPAVPVTAALPLPQRIEVAMPSQEDDLVFPFAGAVDDRPP